MNQKRKIVGLVTMDHIQSKAFKDPIKKHMYRYSNTRYEIVTPDTLLNELDGLFEKTVSVFVTDTSGRFPLAVVTKEDVEAFMKKQK
jgi:predicted transcriptional regulator